MRSIKTLAIIIAAGMIVCSPSHAPAQCAPAWTNPFESPIGKPNFNTGVNFDPDGEGPLPNWAVFTGRFVIADGTTHDGVAGWDGTDWTPLGPAFTLPTGTSTFILNSVVFDDDGPGPHPAALWMGGNFSNFAGVSAQGIARFSNGVWGGTNEGIPPVGAVIRMVVLDEDGVGPLMPRLCIHGSFSGIGERIAILDGDHWQILGGGAQSGGITDLQSVDLDGDGPQPTRLVVVGDFSSFSETNVNHIGQWTGTAWESVGGGTDGPVRSATLHDPDGPGPRAAELCVVGDFTHAGGTPTSGIARYRDGAWQSIDAEFATSPAHIEFLRIFALDDDGPGPRSQSLYVCYVVQMPIGNGVARISRNNGDSWQDITPPNSAASIERPVSMNMNGSVAERLWCGNRYWNGSDWIRLRNPESSLIYAMAAFDLDGSGPAGRTLVVGGEKLDLTERGYSDCVAQWNGRQWLLLGPEGITGQVRAMEMYDPDGAGPAEGELLIAGRIVLNGQAYGVVRLTDGGWEPFANSVLGAGVTERVSVMAIYDADGAGGAMPEVFLSGSFQSLAGEVNLKSTAKWNGTAWVSMGPFSPGIGFNALLVQDVDDDGPARPILFASFFPSTFPSQYPFPNGGVIRWDGQAWSALVDVQSGDIPVVTGNNCLASFDQGDGHGKELCAGGTIYSDTPSPPRGSRYRAGTWQPMGNNLTLQFISAFAVHDDGVSTGLRPTLYFAGNKYGGAVFKNAGKWDGAQWQALGTGVNFAVRALASVDFDDENPSPPELVYAGQFTRAGTIQVNGLASWTVPTPFVLVNPWSRTVAEGSLVSIKVSARGAAPLAYQWRKDGQTISDGGGVSGSTTRELIINSAQSSDIGIYDCVVSNDCGPKTSDPARLHVCTAMPGPDTNHDGMINGLDISPFVAAWQTGPADGICTVDLNANGTMDAEDLQWFIAWLLAP